MTVHSAGAKQRGPTAVPGVPNQDWPTVDAGPAGLRASGPIAQSAVVADRSAEGEI